MRKIYCVIPICILILFFAGSAKAQDAVITDTIQEFKTYPYSLPNPYVSFYDNTINPNTERIYPYFRFDGYTNNSIQKKWKVIRMENQFIRVLIMPDIGGKVWAAIDKTTGNDFIYFNKVVKFRDIALRGAWTMGGLEFNFGPVGHFQSTASPVDYMIRKNDDGSVSCFIGDIDLSSRTEWRVEIRLPKDKAYFETRSFWYNPTPLSTHLYNWSNAAMRGQSDLKFCYPGNYYLGHDGSVHSWTDENGKDISYYKNNDFGTYKSYHVNGVYGDFYGGYYKNSDFGFVHYSPYNEKVGKKLWIFGLSRQGMIWENILTDTANNRIFIEYQSGLFYNQPMVESIRSPFKGYFFAPGSAVSFNERWFPVKNIGAFNSANENGSMNVFRRGSYLIFGICPVKAVGGYVKVISGGKELYSKTIDLKPLDTFIDSLKMDSNDDFEIKAGEDDFYFSSKDESEKNLNRPVESLHNFKHESVLGYYSEGIENAKLRDYVKAMEGLKKCLAMDSLYIPALKGIADLYIRNLEWEKASGCIGKALSWDAYDADANFLYGVICRHNRKWYDALDGFGRASLSMSYRSAANAQIAEIYLNKNDLKQSVVYASKALDYDRYNINALKVQVMAYRKLNNPVKMKEAVNTLFQIDPLNHFARFEKYLSEPTEENLESFRKFTRNEMPHERYLETAIGYYSCGMPVEAIKVLENSPSHAIVYYWLAFLTQNSDYLIKARNSSSFLVMPFRSETEEILQWAEKKQSHWKNRYYLGLLYLSRNRKEEAASLLRSCGEQPDFAPFYVTRACLGRSLLGPASSLSHWAYGFKLSDDAQLNGAEGIEKDFLKAASLDADYRISHYLFEYYLSVNEVQKASSLIRKTHDKFPDNYVVGFDNARALLYNGKFDECISVLEKITILPYEGSGEGHALFRQACLIKALRKAGEKKYREAIIFADKARLWPENLGAGKPYDVDESLEDFILAKCYQKTGRNEEAGVLLKAVLSATEKNDKVFLHSLALKETGGNAVDYFEKNDEKKDEIFSAWATAMMKGDQASAAKSLAKKELNAEAIISHLYIHGDKGLYYLLCTALY